ncbi:hypothetical protein PR048_017535 [Dryococelus australis]|uniref:Uncharacterized protein n=1 Tax=Dryococelus australis TaxID=614101 RepID=A0ABQ9H9U6_9NEOP|nr:hypothetical protein PR048_017535 [Dryococelus australis]
MLATVRPLSGRARHLSTSDQQGRSQHGCVCFRPPLTDDQLDTASGIKNKMGTVHSSRTMLLIGGFARVSPVYSAPAFRPYSILTSLHPHRGSQDSGELALAVCSTLLLASLHFHHLNVARQVTEKDAFNASLSAHLRYVMILRTLFDKNNCKVISPMEDSRSTICLPKSIPCGVTPGFLQYANRAGRCGWSTGFLGDLPFPPLLHSGADPNSPRFTLIGSQVVVKSETSPHVTELVC